MTQPMNPFGGREAESRTAAWSRNGFRPVLLAAAWLLAACVTVHQPARVAPGDQPDVSAALQDANHHVLKRKVAIARFSNETMYGKSVLLGDKRSLIGQKAADILATRLKKSGKLMLFERSDSEQLLRALDAGRLKAMNLPADYLIVGSLSEYGRSTTGKTGVFSRTKKQKAYARVNLRLVEVETGRVIYAEEGAGEASTETGTVMGMGTKAGYDSSLGEKAISAAISKLVSNVLENLMAQPWRSYVLSRDGANLVIAGGAAQGLQVGDRLALVRRGKKVRNPQTRLMIELPGTRVATLEVVSQFGTSPLDQGSMCKVVSGEAPASDLARYVVEEEK